MPRGGSPPDAPGGNRPPVPIAPMDIGEVANAPFAVLPDPATLFAKRAARCEATATGHSLEGYLRLLAGVARAQHRIQGALPPAILPQAEVLARALANGMPPISIGQFAPDDVSDVTLRALIDALKLEPAADSAGPTLAALRDASHDTRRAMVQALLFDEVPADQIAPHMLVAAAVQVHFARLASQLDAKSLTKIAPGACPACGGKAVTSSVVGWEGAANTRFCTCSLCATQWNVPRVTCLTCGGEKGLTYRTLDGGSEHIKAEACEACGSYVKILYQLNAPDLEAFADDVASLGLDMKLRDEGIARASANPFLLGY